MCNVVVQVGTLLRRGAPPGLEDLSEACSLIRLFQRMESLSRLLLKVDELPHLICQVALPLASSARADLRLNGLLDGPGKPPVVRVDVHLPRLFLQVAFVEARPLCSSQCLPELLQVWLSGSSMSCALPCQLHIVLADLNTCGPVVFLDRCWVEIRFNIGTYLGSLPGLR